LVPMWVIGVSGSSFDTLVQTRTIRHGNYDFVTRTTTWDASNSD